MLRENRLRQAFTLVELLVVIAIIGILIGLLLPAIQAAREAGRRSHCANNMKQMGLACHLYADSNGTFPPNGTDNWSGFPYLDNNKKGSYFIRILPYMEQKTLYDKIDFQRNPEAYSIVDVAARSFVYQQVIPTFLCPSDPDTAGGGPWPGGGRSGRAGALSNYGFSIGNQNFSRCGQGGNMFGTGSREHGDSMNPDLISGIYSSMWYAARFAEITDGLSNTISMGEIRPLCSVHLQDGWMHINCFWIGTTGVINAPTCPGDQGYDLTRNPSNCHHEEAWGWAQGFKSLHPGGAQFNLGDGSVRFLRNEIDYVTYQRLGDRRDGGTVSDL